MLQTTEATNRGTEVQGFTAYCYAFYIYWLSTEAIFTPAKINIQPADRFISLVMMGFIPTLIDLNPKYPYSE